MLLLATTLLTVKIGALECTKDPAPTPPTLEVLRAPKGALRLRVLGTGAYCAGADWSATAGHGGAIALTATFNVDAPACGATCSIVLTIDGVSRGAHAITLDKTTVHARAR